MNRRHRWMVPLVLVACVAMAGTAAVALVATEENHQVANNAFDELLVTADPVRVTTPENTNVVGGVTAGIVPQADQANGNVSQMNEVCGDSAGINVNGSEVNVNGADPTEGILSLAVYIYDESTDQAPTLIANTKDFNGAGTIGTNSSAVANNAVAQPVCSTCHDARVTSASG